MRRFAQLNTSGLAVSCVFDWDVPGVSPEYHPSLVQPVEVTGLDPQPAAGWAYDAETGVFTAPVG